MLEVPTPVGVLRATGPTARGRYLPVGRWCLSLRAGPPAAGSGASDGLYLAAGRPAQPPPLDRRTLARSWGTEQPLSRSPHPAITNAVTLPVPLPCTELAEPGRDEQSRAEMSRAGQQLAASAGTPRPAGITHVLQASPREGPSRAPAPGEGIGSLHAAVPGASIPWDPMKGTGRVAAGQRDAGHTPWHRELPGEGRGRAAQCPLSQGLSGGQRDAASSPAAHPGAFRTHPCPRTSRRPPAPPPGSRLTGRTR